MNKSEVTRIVFDAIDMANHARENDQKIPQAADTALYGKQGHLDSMGLVAFLIDIEETLMDQGVHVSLSDERAMSQTQSPFRSVQTLVDYISELLEERET